MQGVGCFQEYDGDSVTRITGSDVCLYLVHCTLLS